MRQIKKILNNLITENEQNVLLFLAALAFLGLLARYAGLNAQVESSSSENPDFAQDYEIKYDLRIVTKSELITIPGIGEKRAEDILAYRHEFGFQRKDDLLKVKGIGPASFSKIAGYFGEFGETVNENTDQAEKDVHQKQDAEFSALININTADQEELQKLPGIGPAKAEKILALRTELGGFSSKDELLQINGIGPKTLSKLKDQITLGD